MLINKTKLLNQVSKEINILQEEEEKVVNFRANQRRCELTMGALTRENRQNNDRIQELEHRLMYVLFFILFGGLQGKLGQVLGTRFLLLEFRELTHCSLENSIYYMNFH